MRKYFNKQLYLTTLRFEKENNNDISKLKSYFPHRAG